MAHHVEHMHSAQAVDDAIVREVKSGRLVVVRFGRSGHDDCVRFDAAMAAAAEWVAPVAALIAVDIDEVQDFNVMYELDEPCTAMFFYWGRCIDVRGFRSTDDLSNSNDWAALSGPDEFAGVVAAVHRKASKGCRIVELGQP